MAQPAPRRIAIMGAPGAGKSTLIAELDVRGWRTVPEAARIILQQPGGMELRESDPIGFAHAMLEADQSAFEFVEAGETVIFDRGFCDIVAFLRIEGHEVPDAIERACRKLRFDDPVLHAPAWRDIYRQDDERIQTWKQAVESDRQNLQAWRDYGYDPASMPRTDASSRADWVERLIASS